MNNEFKNTVKNLAEDGRLVGEVQLNLIGVDTSDDRGAISTEMALVMAGIVGAAIALVIIFRRVADNAGSSIPGA